MGNTQSSAGADMLFAPYRGRRLASLVAYDVTEIESSAAPKWWPRLRHNAQHVVLKDALRWGFLRYRGNVGHVFRDWRRGFFVLAGRHLCHVEGCEPESRLKGAVDVSKDACHVELMPEIPGKQESWVEVSSTQEEWSIILEFPTSELLQSWMKALFDAQQRAASFKELQPPKDKDAPWETLPDSDVSKAPAGCKALPTAACITERRTRTLGSHGSSSASLGLTATKYGSFSSVSGDRYTGWVRLGQKHGWGCLLLANGDTLTGVWSFDHLKGRVRHTGVGDGSVYEGEFEDWQRHGVGTLTMPGGDVWECQWRHGAVQAGTGTHYSADGEVYIGCCAPSPGQPKVPCRYGHGRLRSKEGRQVEAYFTNGLVLDGSRIVLRYPSGAIYFGVFQSGRPHGYGEIYLSGSNRSSTCPKLDAMATELLWYKGAFRDGLPHGWGLVKYKERRGRQREPGGWLNKEDHPLPSARRPMASGGTGMWPRGLGGFTMAQQPPPELEDDDEEEEEEEEPSPRAAVAPSLATTPRQYRSLAISSPTELEFEMEFREGVMVRYPSGNLRLAALKLARADLQWLQKVVQREEEALTRMRAKELCLICNTNEMNALLVGCRHRVMCMGCAGAAAECPVCHTVITKIVRTYVA